MNQPRQGIVELNTPGVSYPIGTEATSLRVVTLARGLEPGSYFDNVMKNVAREYGALMTKIMDPIARKSVTKAEECALLAFDFPRVVWVFASLGIDDCNRRIAALEASNRELQQQVLKLSQIVTKLAKTEAGAT